MKKPNNFDNTVVREGGKQLPAGGYVCKIVGIKEQKSKAGKDMVVVAVDIAEGEYKDHFKNIFDANEKADKTWPNGAVSYILLEDQNGECTEQFKKLITFLEKSNGMTTDWGADYNQFKNKLIGVTFRREEFEGNNGRAFTTKAAWFNTVDQIRKGVDVPKDKLLQGSSSQSTFISVEEEDDLPF